MTLKKSNMIDLLNEEIGLTKVEAKSIVNEFFEVISCSLETGKMVNLRQFGIFKILDKNERPGRNPKTGEAYNISARKVVTFKANKDLVRIKERSINIIELLKR